MDFLVENDELLHTLQLPSKDIRNQLRNNPETLFPSGQALFIFFSQSQFKKQRPFLSSFSFLFSTARLLMSLPGKTCHPY